MTKPYDHTREGRTLRFVAWAIAIGAILIILYAMFWPHEAKSQDAPQKCMPLDLMLKAWKTHYSEIIVASAVGSTGKLSFRLLLSPGGTFTLLGTDLKGMTCVLAAGEDWHFDDPKPPGEDS
jgi:hypothetical protein